ncbi:DUF2520 domain-containing protein [Corynebacterium terpenotabidum]|uniref:DUF2520 domain-containing protein n=1 Tax=Corynebacterium terpenotabidum Y-11 TaxID=1200352 RepID=S4XBU3_9CORY|nr:DUF2520 domain-containing protein [Corynebacterium terpenotabidum]AGP30051.1 hypothetical protein A606_01980 [Corynebacterium terpenotabidum Y-11]
MTGPTFVAPHPDRQEPRLSVGVISAGAVGTAVAEALQRAGHHLHGVVARSEASRARAAARLPGVPVVDVADAAHAALIILAVPDPQLSGVVARLAQVVTPGQIIMHTAGSLGCGVLQPLTDIGALPLALHPAMTFTGGPEDTDHLVGCAWGVTVDSDTGAAVAELLVGTLGGIAVPVAEEHRTVYHAAMAHGSNHLVTLVSEALEMLDHALADPEQARQASPSVEMNPNSAVLLRRILPAALAGALDRRMGALTGPTARDDAATVLRHLAALEALGVPDIPDDAGSSVSVGGGLVASYRSSAHRTARAVGSFNVERALEED